MIEEPSSFISPELLQACIHCGLCLPACPTYNATGREMESPRGRIHLMTLWNSGKEPLEGRMAEHLESCLGCLGCQTACPSGVQYEKIINSVRPHMAKSRSRYARRLMRLLFSRLLPDYPRLRSLARMVRMWQRLVGRNFVSRLPDTLWFRKWKSRLSNWEKFMPEVPDYKQLPAKSWRGGRKTGVVQFFAGCVMDVLYNHVNHAAVRLLTGQGKVVEVGAQTCCGALAFHAGEVDIARRLARQNIELMERTQGPIVVTAAGCGAMLKEYGDLFGKEDPWRAKAQDFSLRVVDLVESISEGSFNSKPLPLEGNFVYHAACHLHHAQGITDLPGRLLADIPDLKVTPLVESDACCGSAGVFNLTHTSLSLDILARKMDCIQDSQADTVVTTNPGCLLQIDYGIRTKGLNIKVKHLAEVLDEAYRSG